jgi:hypothetical protein
MRKPCLLIAASLALSTTQIAETSCSVGYEVRLVLVNRNVRSCSHLLHLSVVLLKSAIVIALDSA